MTLEGDSYLKSTRKLLRKNDNCHAIKIECGISYYTTLNRFLVGIFLRAYVQNY